MQNWKPFAWGVAVGLVAMLNIIGVLPGWVTIAAVLTLPFFACITGRWCGSAEGSRT